MQKSKTKTVIAIMLLMLVAFIPMVSAQEETLTDSSNARQVIIELNQKDGVLIIPTENKKNIDLSTTVTAEKSAKGFLSGTIDGNNHVIVEGVITLDGKDDKVQLSGEATQVFTGWDVPEGAKPIYSKVGNMTMTRYEGTTEMYATYVDLQDKKGKYKLHGEFYDGGNGGIVGIVTDNGVECEIGLLGSSLGLYENVSPTSTTKDSRYLAVPQRSQWEIFYYQGNYTAASQACGETSAAMLEEYWSSNHPSIWDIWEYNGYEPMNGAEAQDYLDDQGIYLSKGLKTGSFYGTTNEIVNMIDNGRPFFMIEESKWGTCHAVVLKGYCYGPNIDPYFKLNDPNTWTGTTVMNWYDTDDPQFNYEENVYEYTCADDTSSTGYFYLG